MVGADQLEQTRQLRRRMLAVGVDPTAVRVVVLERPAVTRRDPDRKAAVPSEREHLGAVLARTSAVRSVEPSSTTRTSALGSTRSRSSRTAGRFCSSFQAGMKTSVSLMVPALDELGARRSKLPPAERGGCDLPRDRASALRDGRRRGTRSGPRAGRRAGEEEPRAVDVERRADDYGAFDPALEQKRERARGVLGGDRRGRLHDELDVRPRPGQRICSASEGSSARAAGEHDDVDRLAGCDPLGLANELETGARDRRRAAAAPTIPEHDDRGSHVLDGTRRGRKHRHAVRTILPGYSDPIAEPRNGLVEPRAPVAQWIEQRFPKPRALVRFRPGASTLVRAIPTFSGRFLSAPTPDFDR